MNEPDSEFNQDNLEKELKDALESIKDDVFSALASEVIAEGIEEELDLEAENAHLDFQNRLDKKKRREEWDTSLKCLVILGFGFSYMIIILIGGGILEFGDNAFAVPSVVAAGVIQTYGLAKLAIQYFFSDDGKKD